MKPEYLWRYTELPFLIDFLSTKKLALLNPSYWDDRNDSYFIRQFTDASEFQSVYALCLSEASETYHHWKVFSSGSAGACIVFKRDNLIKNAKKTTDLRAESVSYPTIEKLKTKKFTTEDLPYLKRFPFRDEREFRLFLPKTTKQTALCSIPIPLNAVDRVILSPWLPQTVADHSKKLLKQIDGCSKLRIHRSTLIENETWKKLATK